MKKYYAHFSLLNNLIPLSFTFDSKSLCKIDFEDGIDSSKDALFDPIYDQFQAYFSGKLKVFNIDYVLKSGISDFSKSILNELCKNAPYGKVLSYKELASFANNPNASRAAGSCMRKNQLPILIPCHRVIPSSGGYGNYAGGIFIKRQLLELEGVVLDSGK